MFVLLRPLLVLALSCATAATYADCLFPAWQSTALPSQPIGLRAVVGDLNGDGYPDLVTASHSGVSVTLHDGIGQLAAQSTLIYSMTTTIAGLLPPAEVTGGGGVDIVLVDRSLSAIVTLPGNGDGTFGTPITSPYSGTLTIGGWADFDHDGARDLAFGANIGVVVHRGNGDGTFSAAASLITQNQPTAVITADLDADGHADIVSAARQAARLEIFFGTGTTTFEAVVVQPAMNGVWKLAAADLDNDGDLEILGTTGSLAVMRNLTGRTFGDPLSTPGEAFDGLVVADVNGDGALDVTTSSSRSVTTFAGTGTGLFTRFATVPLPYVLGSLSSPADFDGDGRLDLLGISYGVSNPVTLLRNLCLPPAIKIDAARVVTVETTNRVTVTMTPPNGMTLLPTGTLTLRDGEAVLGVRELNAGKATFDLSLPLGDYTLTASYGGDEQYAPDSATFTQKVTAERTTTVITMPAEIDYGQLLSASVHVTSTIASLMNLQIEFYLDGVKTTALYYPPPLRNTWTGRPAAGAHTLEARFLGDTVHPPSSSIAHFTVRKAMPDVVVTPRIVAAGQEFELFVRVSIPDALSVKQPTGTLTVSRGTTMLGTKPLWFAFPSAALPPPRQFFRLQYSGDANFKAFDIDEPVMVHTGGVNLIDARGSADMIRVATLPVTEIHRREPAAWAHVGWNTFDDTSRAPGVVTLYRPLDGLPDVAMRISFTDELLRPGMIVRAVHVAEIVGALNKLRSAAGLAPSTVSITPAMPVTASTLLTLRSEIAEARGALGAYAFQFTGTIAPGEPMRALHLLELREAIR